MMYDGFERPTEHYDERVKEIDKEICRLIKQRSETVEDPGMPTDELISIWANEYHFYEDFLNGLFGHILAEKYFFPQIEPKNFIESIPVLSSFQKDDLFYAITSIRQYENASVLYLSVDHDTYDGDDVHLAHAMIGHDLELNVVDAAGVKYYCQNRGSGGFGSHTSFQFLITPPLEKDLKGISFKFSNGPDEKNFKVVDL